jgi:hypothetical protein
MFTGGVHKKDNGTFHVNGTSKLGFIYDYDFNPTKMNEISGFLAANPGTALVSCHIAPQSLDLVLTYRTTSGATYEFSYGMQGPVNGVIFSPAKTKFNYMVSRGIQNPNVKVDSIWGRSTPEKGVKGLGGSSTSSSGATF